MEYKYEKVTDMTVGQVVAAWSEGEKFYAENHKEIDFSKTIVGVLDRAIADGSVFRRIETKWADSLPQECVVWDDGHRGQGVTIRAIDLVYHSGFITDKDVMWDHAHPITDDTTVGQMKDMIKGVD